jgi:hypothetical protein
MKFLKKFNLFEKNQISSIEYFYICDECDSNWIDNMENLKFCKFCNSFDVEEIDVNEYREISESKNKI